MKSSPLCKRAAILVRQTARILALLSGGAAAAGALVWFTDFPRLVHESHGLIGFAVGVAFVGGIFVSNIAVWLVSGRWLMADLICGEDS